MNPLHLILVLGSIICFVLAAWQYKEPTWPRLACVGAALAVASLVSW